MKSSVDLPPTVQVNFTLGIGHGRLDASLEVPSGHVTLTQILPVLQTLTSNIVDAATVLVSTEGYQVSCRAGCGACCRQLVPLSIFEAEFLTEWIHSLPAMQQQALNARFNTTVDALKATNLLPRLLTPHLWQEEDLEARTLAADYLEQEIPCPFLHDESCSIHPIRPLICREYLVTSDPVFCARPTRETVVPIPIPLKSSSVLFGLGSLVEEGTTGWIPLPLLFVWMQTGGTPGQAIEGLGHELLHEFVKRYTS
ncbi:YkgJ family cysteine cluster protein [Granulicella tundricola]|uniref:YkgJ family cysteine cluster protein n=1 Tax=Granulicella tundricola (strain ATCC BAA-1859 / DSM 23138 / MP5ACTX9) TaxID=1198114 RepID=E8X3R6_GRATM|nr:YkgJ family cysteine cluster protein [Granulicella tundricola]ADW69344.1 protein of unknown function UPF0153 [Granulicella tundricola MP5ACTX9]